MAKNMVTFINQKKMEEKHGQGPTMYGYCAMSEAWLPRAEMLSANVKMFDQKGNASTVKLRLAPDMWSSLLDQLVELEWDNKLKSRDEIEELGEPIIESVGSASSQVQRKVRNMSSWWNDKKL